MTAHPTFTPSAMDIEELDSLTVGRDALLDTLVRRIRGAVRDGSRPHTLLVAPRGGGKTHTLHVAVHRGLANSRTAQGVLPVLIPEDALAIGSYADLLVEIARTVDDGLGETARELRRHRDTVGIEEAILAAAAGRMILLAVENLDRVFDALGESGQGNLRAWVETSTAITIFGTAPMLFPGVSSRSYPWYGSFMVESLPEFTVAEGAIMVGRAARRRGDAELAAFVESPQGLARLQVIHRLAGGSPRWWHILADCADLRSLDALVPAVEALLDRSTPYYQQRLWQLPPGEQRLVVELARSWEPRTVSDLAAAVGVSNQTAAAALGRLASSHWVTAAKSPTGDRRASWYDLTEPLLRYQLQFRENRREPLRLIVEFLRAGYAEDRVLPDDTSSWSAWARDVVAADAVTPRHTDDPLATAIGILLAIEDDGVRWENLPAVMSALTADDREWVAARIAVHARLFGMTPHAEFDPLRFAGEDARGAVRFAWGLHNETAARS